CARAGRYTYSYPFDYW
nr:immunoglobulin heavy chain junction region [Macaca mulatta]MOX59648.1 immunoglobulin heavy chain junction region [Macaca mulatta]MOX60559.1 immunoglobulin heavy chain junction region [Macaca mulatta]MOX60978.1 immunoglobulin heavy chain junction region [Macaca mulatta]MOX61055.1 immunoglobulin heavy chain junction region [Macaca mulatta]